VDQRRLIKTFCAYFLVAGLEAGFCVGYLLYLPTNAQRGYSISRLVIIAGLILAFLGCVLLINLTRRHPARMGQVIEQLSGRRANLWAILLNAILIFLGGITFFLLNPVRLHDLEPYYIHLHPLITWTVLEAYFTRLQPVILWVILVSAQTILGLLYLYRGQLREDIQVDFAKPMPRLVTGFVILGALSLLLASVIKTMPFLILRDEDRALRLAQEPAMLNLDGWVLGIVIVINLLAAWLIQKKFRAVKISSEYPQWYRFLYLLALAGAYILLTIIVVNKCWFGGLSGWSVFYLSGDSGSYIAGYSSTSSRPPLYPLFIDLATAGTSFKHSTEGYLDHEAVKNVNDPLMRVTRAQKIALLGASLVACFALMGLTNPPLAATFFLWLYDHSFFTQLTSYILTETLNQTLVFLLIAVFLAFIWKRRRWLIPCAGVLCAALFLTRPASLYGGVFMAVMLVMTFLWNWRVYWLPALISLLLAGGLVSLPILYTYIKTGYLLPTPAYPLQLWPFAIEFAKPEDIAYMPDELSRQLLTKVLAVKSIEDEKVKAQYPDERQTWQMLVRNNYRGPIYSTVNEVLPNATDKERVALRLRVSSILLKRHRLDHLQFAWNSFIFATNIQTRLKFPFYFWAIVALLLVLSIWLRNWVSLSVLTFTFAHLVHLVIVSLYDLPLARYVWDTEYLVLIAVFILVWGLWDKITGIGILNG